MFFDHAAQFETVAVLIIEGPILQPKAVIKIFAGGAIEGLVDHIGTGTAITEELAHISENIRAAPDLIGFATMNADESGAAKIIAGGVAQHRQNVFGRYADGFHVFDVRVTFVCILSRDTGDEADIDGLN